MSEKIPFTYSVEYSPGCPDHLKTLRLKPAEIIEDTYFLTYSRNELHAQDWQFKTGRRFDEDRREGVMCETSDGAYSAIVWHNLPAIEGENYEGTASEERNPGELTIVCVRRAAAWSAPSPKVRWEVKTINNVGYLPPLLVEQELNAGWEPIGGPYCNQGNYVALMLRRQVKPPQPTPSS